MYRFSEEELKNWIENDDTREALVKEADQIRRENYGVDVYLRGLIECTNYCKNNCYYCGIRCGNTKVERYRLSKDTILACCKEGYQLGYRTFVLQGGEDPHYTDAVICDIVSSIKENHPDCAVTLSLGEKEKESYQAYYDAGADRYLLREETALEDHYGRLHPKSMKLETRKRCLWNLKEIGFQVGAGFMVDAPYQTTENIIADLHFLEELEPDMIGIGPFVTHSDTPFARYPSGSVEKTIRLIAILRKMFPKALIPATTALGTMDPKGREKGLQAGANVIMPNLSPESVRGKYELYNNKIQSGAELAQNKKEMEQLVKNAGYQVVTGRGDVKR